AMCPAECVWPSLGDATTMRMLRKRCTHLLQWLRIRRQRARGQWLSMTLEQQPTGVIEHSDQCSGPVHSLAEARWHTAARNTAAAFAYS
ncbi:hypothetical protein HaLaN_09531, partial [Haematococcus lacustris]